MYLFLLTLYKPDAALSYRVYTKKPVIFTTGLYWD